MPSWIARARKLTCSGFRVPTAALSLALTTNPLCSRSAHTGTALSSLPLLGVRENLVQAPGPGLYLTERPIWRSYHTLRSGRPLPVDGARFKSTKAKGKAAAVSSPDVAVAVAYCSPLTAAAEIPATLEDTKIKQKSKATTKSKRTAKQTKTKEACSNGDASLDESFRNGNSEEENPKLTFPFEGNATEEGVALGKESAVDGGSKELFRVSKTESAAGRFYQVMVEEETYRLPSVTTVLKDTRSKNSFFGLWNWRRSMIKEHGEEGYRKIRSERMQAGTEFHQLLESRLLESRSDLVSIKPQSLEEAGGRQLESMASPTTSPAHRCTVHETSDYSTLCDTIPEESGEAVGVEEGKKKLLDSLKSSGLFQSVQHVLEDVSEVCAVESIVTHLQLGYTGTCDCIAKYKGKLCVIDWKTSSKPRPSLSLTYDSPIQAAAYAGAVNQDPHYPFKVEGVLVVIAYPTGDPAHVHFLSQEQCLEFWGQWLARVQEYQTQFANDLSEMHFE